MGNESSKSRAFSIPSNAIESINFGSLQRQLRDFAKWTLDDVKKFDYLFRKTLGFSISQSQFESLMTIKPSEAITAIAMFDALDSNNDGRIDGLEFIGGLILCCQASFEEKSQFAFEVYDFNLNGSLSVAEMALLMRSTFCGMMALTGCDPSTYPPNASFLSLSRKAFDEYDKDDNGGLTYHEFIQWARSNRDIMHFVEKFRTITVEAKGTDEDEDPAIEGSDCDSEVEEEGVFPSHLIEFEAKQTNTKAVQSVAEGIPAPWSIEPTKWKPSNDSDASPSGNLELDWVNGYRCHDSRNNLRYTVSGEIVYIAANLGIVYDKKLHQQRYYQGHTQEIVSLAMHPSGDKVATGQIGCNTEIHIWHTQSLSCLSILKGFHDVGISLLSFSGNGSTLASVGMDSDHRVAVWDWHKQAVLASARGGTTKLLACAMSNDGSEIIVCGNKVLNFFSPQGRIMNSKKGFIGKKGSLQMFLCACYFGKQVMVGTAGGHLYQFTAGVLTHTIQAHAIHESVTCLYASSTNIISGGKDGVVHVWDEALKPVGVAVDIGMDLDGPGNGDVSSMQPRIISVCMRNGKILVGTRGSEIMEIDNRTGYCEKLIDGHCASSVAGVASSPRTPTYATTGSDQTVRVWNIRKRCMLNFMKIQAPGTCITYNSSGTSIAVGCSDGSIYFVQDTLETKYLHFQHTTEAILQVRFAPNDSVLAVAGADGIIYLYQVLACGKKLARQSVLIGHYSPVQYVDFALNSKTLQSVDEARKIKFWDVFSGSEKSNMAAIRDIVWATWTCPIGWPVKGLEPQLSNVKALDRSRTQDVIAVAQEDGEVALYRYPCVSTGALNKLYKAHSVKASGVSFALNDRYLLSTGDTDHSICQWRVEFEDEDEQSSTLAAKDESTIEPEDMLLEVLASETEGGGDQFMAIKPYLGAIVAPTAYTPSSSSGEATDVDIELEWIHGMNCQTLRNMVFYTSQGELVYPAATLGVVYNHVHKTQRYHKHHQTEIISIALHPSGKFIATGSIGKHPMVAVWNTDTMETVFTAADVHKRGVCQLAFDGCGAGQSGDLLASIGLDDNHTLVLHAWKKNLRVAEAKTTKSKILASSFSGSDDRLITSGVNHIMFWKIRGNNIKSQKGIFGRHAKLQTILCIAPLKDVTITGGTQGDLIIWQGHHAAKTLSKAHEGPVNCVCRADDESFVSGGKDGFVKLWQLQPKRSELSCVVDLVGIFDVSNSISPPPTHPAIRSVCLQDGKVVATTQSSDLLEFAEGLFVPPDAAAPAFGAEQATCLSNGHFFGEVWGVATHPDALLCASAGDDGTIRIWNLENKRMERMMKLQDKARAVAYSPLSFSFSDSNSANHLAVGMFKGSVLILRSDTLEELAQLKCGKKWIQALRYAPDAATLAIGSHDAKIYIYSIDKSSGAYQELATCRGHGSYITNLDYSHDGTQLQSNSGDYELLFWTVQTGEQIKSAISMRDTQWDTWTCSLGWPVQGIFPPEADGTDINAVERAHGTWKANSGEEGSSSDPMAQVWQSLVPVVATGDDHGLIKLFKYPCLATASAKTYQGHGSHVTKLAFSYNDGYLVSAGGRDRCIFVWKTDCIEETMEAEAALSIKSERPVSPAHKARGKGAEQALALELKDNDHDTAMNNLSCMFAKMEASGGDEFMAVKPWVGAIREPSQWKPSADADEEPTQALELDFVHGYRTLDTRNNLRPADDSWEIVYHAAAVGIVYNTQTNRQIFNRDHTDDIISLAVHPEGHAVATGESGKKPKIVIWDANSGSSLAIIKGFHQRGIAQLAFNASGSLLASIGMDNDHSLAIYKLDGSLVAKSKGNKAKVLGLAFNDSDLVSVGLKHVQFWTLNQTTLTSKKGLFGKKAKSSQPILCCEYLGTDVVSSQVDGTLYLWKGRNCSSIVQAHKGAAEALAALADGQGLISGGKDGLVKLWGRTLDCTQTFDLNKMEPTSFNPAVRSVFLRDGKILVGTLASEIYEIDMATFEQIDSKWAAQRHIQGHCRGELWGLDVNPANQEYVSAGDDGSLRLWDAPNRKMLSMVSLQSKARSVAYSPDGKHLAVGMHNGSLIIYSADLKTCIKKAKCSKKWIEVLKYSPDGKTLAVGSHDRKIYLFKAPSYSKRAICKGHSSYITHLDFSRDSKYLQSNCGAYELLFWDVSSGKQITSAMSMRDTKWASWTCTLGWPVQGIWPKCADGTDVNSVCRSTDGKTLVTADDSGNVKIMRYPSVTPGSPFKVYGGHSSHVTTCLYTQDDKFVVSSGGMDNCILQWKYLNQ